VELLREPCGDGGAEQRADGLDDEQRLDQLRGAAVGGQADRRGADRRGRSKGTLTFFAFIRETRAVGKAGAVAIGKDAKGAVHGGKPRLLAVGVLGKGQIEGVKKRGTLTFDSEAGRK
jgi:hypothetical protein